MPIDPNIALGIKPPDVNITPLDTASKVIALRNLVAENQLRQAQQANINAEAQQRLKDQQDQSTVADMLKSDPDFQKAFGQGDTTTLGQKLAGKVQSKTYQDIISKSVTQQQGLAALTKDKQERLTAFHGQLADLLSGVDPKDDNAAASQLTQGLSGLQSDFPEFADKIQPNGINKDQVRNQIQTIGAVNRVQRAALDKVAAAGKTQAETSHLNAQASELGAQQANLEAQLPGIQSDVVVKQAKQPTEVAIAQATAKDPNLLTPAEREKANEEAQNLTLSRKRVDIERGQLGVAQTREAREAAKQNAEIGPGTIESEGKNVMANPDSAASVPAVLKPAVTKWLQDKGYNFPKPASATATTQEQAARNALQAISQIREAIQDPDVNKRQGFILGRIGSAENDVGATVGLSPDAARKAQQLRTGLRYLFTQELKANIGARPSEYLGKQLESASPNVNLSGPLMQGALNGVEQAAFRTADAVDKERFGGTARPRLMRGLPSSTYTGPDGHKIATDDDGKTWYDAQTFEPIKGK